MIYDMPSLMKYQQHGEYEAVVLSFIIPSDY